LYIGDLKTGAFQADLITNWQASKYYTSMALQNDVAKKGLWHSTGVKNPRVSNSATLLIVRGL
jgi:hypothetical protein